MEVPDIIDNSTRLKERLQRIESQIHPDTYLHVAIPLYLEFSNGNVLEIFRGLLRQQLDPSKYEVIFVVNNKIVDVRNTTDAFRDSKITLACVKFVNDQGENPFPAGTDAHDVLNMVKEKGIQIVGVDASSPVADMSIGAIRNMGNTVALERAASTHYPEDGVIVWSDGDTTFRRGYLQRLYDAYMSKDVSGMMSEGEYVGHGGTQEKLAHVPVGIAEWSFAQFCNILLSPEGARLAGGPNLSFRIKKYMQDPTYENTIADREKGEDAFTAAWLFQDGDFDYLMSHDLIIDLRVREESFDGAHTQKVLSRADIDDEVKIGLDMSRVQFYPIEKYVETVFLHGLSADRINETLKQHGLNPGSSLSDEFNQSLEMVSIIMEAFGSSEDWNRVSQISGISIDVFRGWIETYVGQEQQQTMMLSMLVLDCLKLVGLNVYDKVYDTHQQAFEHRKDHPYRGISPFELHMIVDEAEKLLSRAAGDEFQRAQEIMQALERRERKRMEVLRSAAREIISIAQAPIGTPASIRWLALKERVLNGAPQSPIERFLLQNIFLIDWIQEHVDDEHLEELAFRTFPEFVGSYDNTEWRKSSTRLRALARFLREVEKQQDAYPNTAALLKVMRRRR